MFDIAFVYPWVDSSVLCDQENYSEDAVDCLFDEIYRTWLSTNKSDLVFSSKKLVNKYNYNVDALENALFELHSKGLISGNAYYFFYKADKEHERDKSEFYVKVNVIEMEKIRDREQTQKASQRSHDLLRRKAYGCKIY